MSTACPTSPSAASVCDVLDGKSGAMPRFLGHWLLRSALIMPGLVIAGVRDKRLLTGAIMGSTMISLFLLFFTTVERARRGERMFQRQLAQKKRVLRGRTLHGRKALHGRRTAQLRAVRQKRAQLAARRSRAAV